MPVLRNRSAVEIAKGLKAFLNLEAGLTRGGGPVTEQEKQLAARDRQIEKLRGWLAKKDERIGNLRTQLSQNDFKARSDLLEPERLVWIFCASRSGSTWLYNMLDDLESYETWHEPLVGSLFGEFYEKNSHRGGKHYIMGGRREHWLSPVRSFVLEAATAKFPSVLKDKYLAVKEPGSAVGAPLIMEALPESRMIFLVRDPRDVAASSLDASRKGSWFRERRERASSRTAERFATFDENPESQVKKTASGYLRQMTKAGDAYESHQGPKVLVRYEDLVADTLGTMKRIHETLGIPVDEGSLSRTVDKHSWANIPEENRGEGKFYRKGQPGSWREDLTPEQVEIVEKTTATLLLTYYPDEVREPDR